MEVIGVLDLRHGRAMRAVAGERDRYAPARMAGRPDVTPGDAYAIASAYITALELAELYIADLDAIVDGALQAGLVRTIAALGAPLWLDAGITSVDDARAALAAGAHRIVLGLETLPSFDTLAAISQDVGRERAVFSLDLRNRTPIASSTALGHLPPEELVSRAVDTGAGAVIVLDLARVGTNAGPDLDLIERVRIVAPTIPLIAGGGVRGRDDLNRLKDAGCTAALIATALLNGQLTARDIRSLRSQPT